MLVPDTTNTAPIHALAAGRFFITIQRIGSAAIGEIDDSVEIIPVSPPLRPNRSNDIPKPIAKKPLIAILINVLRVNFGVGVGALLDLMKLT